MESLISITSGISVIALIAFVVLLFLVTKEGNDERARYMGYKLFSFLFAFLFGGIALIIFITGLYRIDYNSLRVYFTTLLSLTIIVGLIYWTFVRRKI